MADFGSHLGDLRSSLTYFPVTPGATANTKGTWVSPSWTLDSVTTTRVDGLYINPAYYGDSSTRRTVLVDIGIGAGPTTLISNLMVCPSHENSANTTREVAQNVYFPVSLPGGEAFKMRGQSNMASHPLTYTYIMPMSSGMPCAGSVVDTYGADTTNSKGTTLTASGTEGVFGSWVPITTSSERVKALVIAFGHGQEDWSSFTNQWAIVEIGIGGSGSEVGVLQIADIGTSSATKILGQMWYGPYYLDIPPGTRISGRVRKQHTSADQRGLDVILYGIR